MSRKKVNIIEEQSEPIAVNTRNMKLDDLAKQLASLRPEYRKEVIRTAKKLAGAYKAYQDATATINGLEDLND